ncbi:uncharacterized protein LOC117329605 [Pecten maximus]|uniref:uncharacterized protein LOC117329605 n=1 Tax=Pecten maximus TaxID=6579 RepID=UPI00145821B0|nr:uncharacterized protein LOC117329605 [Pecten maximus]
MHSPQQSMNVSATSPSTTPEGRNNNPEESNEKLQKELLDLQMKYNSMVAEVRDTKQAEEQLNAEIIRLKNVMDEQKREIETKSREKNELLNRLSAVAGQRLRDNNPAIADLSSEIRPTKIAEGFKELYDNEWTEAFIELKDQGYQDIVAIQFLITAVEDSFEFTADISRRRLEHLEASTRALVSHKEEKPDAVRHINKAKTISERDMKSEHRYQYGSVQQHADQKQVASAILSEECADLLKQLRKASAQALVEEIQNCFIENRMRNKETAVKQKAMIDFYKECAKITWFMSVQTPPLTLAPKPAKDSPIQTDLYLQYTQSGSKVDYVVWPACLLHENGPLLAKGVVQPFKPEVGDGAEVGKRKASVHGSHASVRQSGNDRRSTINSNNVNDPSKGVGRRVSCDYDTQF